jgi:hypothetical protein
MAEFGQELVPPPDSAFFIDTNRQSQLFNLILKLLLFL